MHNSFSSLPSCYLLDICKIWGIRFLSMWYFYVHSEMDWLENKIMWSVLHFWHKAHSSKFSIFVITAKVLVTLLVTQRYRITNPSHVTHHCPYSYPKANSSLVFIDKHRYDFAYHLSLLFDPFLDLFSGVWASLEAPRPKEQQWSIRM